MPSRNFSYREKREREIIKSVEKTEQNLMNNDHLVRGRHVDQME